MRVAFGSLKVEQQCAWATVKDYTAPEKKNQVHCFEDGGNCKVKKAEKVGPREGEVQVLKYDSVRDIARMGAVSDHRPVFLVCALGVAEDVVQSDEH